MMRTTLNLPDDVYEVAKAIANAKNVSLGDAVAELARNGLRPQGRIREDNPFPCFSVPPDAPPISLEQTLDAEDRL
jgi:hypothetical protein